MTEEEFVILWDNLYNWNLNTKQLYELGIDITRQNKILYDTIMLLLNKVYNKSQIDFLVWSIFSDDKSLPLADGDSIIIDNAYKCYEYINKEEFKTEQ